MKKQLTYYFFFSIIIGSFIYISEKVEFALPNFVRFYLNDFLIIPIVLYVCLFVIQKLKGNSTIKISLLHILYLCVLYSMIFEYWLPKFHPRYTSDLLDVMLYFLGGGIFYFLQRD